MVLVALLRPWKRTGENARKKRLVFLRLKTRKEAFAFLLDILDISKGEVSF